MMKRQMFTVIALAASLMLILVWGIAAQGPEQLPVSPDSGELPPAAHWIPSRDDVSPLLLAPRWTSTARRITTIADAWNVEVVGQREYYGTPGYAEGVAVSGSTAYVAGGYGLWVVGVSNPASPTELGIHEGPVPPPPEPLANPDTPTLSEPTATFTPGFIVTAKVHNTGSPVATRVTAHIFEVFDASAGHYEGLYDYQVMLIDPYGGAHLSNMSGDSHHSTGEGLGDDHWFNAEVKIAPYTAGKYRAWLIKDGVQQSPEIDFEMAAQPPSYVHLDFWLVQSPHYPFYVAEQSDPTRTKTTNTAIIVFIAITDQNDTPLGGYRVIGDSPDVGYNSHVESLESCDDWCTYTGHGDYAKVANAKFEPGAFIDGTWNIYLVDGAGTQASPVVPLSYSAHHSQWRWDFIAFKPYAGILFQYSTYLPAIMKLPRYVPVVPPPGAQTFGYGIQADPRGNKSTNISHIQALDFGWVKLQMPWKEVEPSQGNYQWGMWDDSIGAYSAAGIKVLLSIPKAPDWARPPGDDKSVEGPPADYATFARFLGEVANRYKGRVQAIEVWNEQNLWYEGGGSPMPPDQYVAMLAAAYGTIKTADPEMIVVSGAPVPAGDVGGKVIDDLNYLSAMYAAGLKDVSDAIGAHPSGYNCPASADWQTVKDPTAIFRGPFDNRHHSWCFRGTMEGYRNVMMANGDADKTVWPTEFGWAVESNPHPGYEYARDNTYEEQAQWIVEAYQMAESWGWVGAMFLWNLDYGVTAAGTELAPFGLLRPGPVPAYWALVDLRNPYAYQFEPVP